MTVRLPAVKLAKALKLESVCYVVLHKARCPTPQRDSTNATLQVIIDSIEATLVDDQFGPAKDSMCVRMSSLSAKYTNDTTAAGTDILAVCTAMIGAQYLNSSIDAMSDLLQVRKQVDISHMQRLECPLRFASCITALADCSARTELGLCRARQFQGPDLTGHTDVWAENAVQKPQSDTSSGSQISRTGLTLNFLSHDASRVALCDESCDVQPWQLNMEFSRFASGETWVIRSLRRMNIALSPACFQSINDVLTFAKAIAPKRPDAGATLPGGRPAGTLGAPRAVPLLRSVHSRSAPELSHLRSDTPSCVRKHQYRIKNYTGELHAPVSCASQAGNN
jgi:hypothetical protein